jgi:hypothetical protein
MKILFRAYFDQKIFLIKKLAENLLGSGSGSGSGTGSGSERFRKSDPDPDKNRSDPHLYFILVRIKYFKYSFCRLFRIY